MEFSPKNNVVMLCIQGMSMEEISKQDEAIRLFLRAWDEADEDLEKFIAAHYVARCQKDVSSRLEWLESALKLALKIDNDAVRSAFPALYSSIARCHEDLNETGKARKYHELAASFNDEPADKGPFYHGTKADLARGDLLTAGGTSNYKAELKMNHVYFTAVIDGAGLAAALAKGEGRQRVYIVEPTGSFENDPNVTNKKFPGNPTRSYRSLYPLKITGEVTDWARQTPEDLQRWRQRLASSKGEIIN